ncbi:Methyltransferase domain protein [Rubripirellula lacrimiformis]|uniref:Methyltransferase domain protein n=1 Tax=Rubripirellula lacrimiformis TaxID=1930273 RepID=A0A517NGS6_9BACT|nr:methyltransferase domain-containing protein [Rubripirellula lacrimiformis]QDT06288.1 Methyltransferase domain protein [Rubripirellula lacrimiformis]
MQKQTTDDSLKRHRLKEQFQAEDGHQNPPAYESYLNRLFGDLELQGRSVLEIGSGRGLISLHCGLAGAEKVVSVEPEMEGSTSGVIEAQAQRIKSLGLKNVDLRRDNFNTMNFGGESFDVIVMIAVLNHLYETPLNAARHQEVFNTYVKIASKLHGLLNKGGVVIATDACRLCLWTQLRRLGYPRSWCLTQRTIDWQIHQQPAVWESIFKEAGFSRFEVSYPIPHRLRKFGGLVGTSPVNFVLMGEFIFHAYK